jgi:hypothetical protein
VSSPVLVALSLGWVFAIGIFMAIVAVAVLSYFATTAAGTVSKSGSGAATGSVASPPTQFEDALKAANEKDGPTEDDG